MELTEAFSHCKLGAVSTCGLETIHVVAVDDCKLQHGGRDLLDGWL